MMSASSGASLFDVPENFVEAFARGFDRSYEGKPEEAPWYEAGQRMRRELADEGIL